MGGSWVVPVDRDVSLAREDTAEQGDVPHGTVGPLTGQRRRPIAGQVDAFARQGLRVLAAAERQLAVGSRPPENREEAVDLQVGIGCETGRPL